jgi:hypothetical protein
MRCEFCRFFCLFLWLCLCFPLAFFLSPQIFLLIFGLDFNCLRNLFGLSFVLFLTRTDFDLFRIYFLSFALFWLIV